MKQTSYTTIAGLNRSLRSLPKTASAEMRDASVAIAEEVAQDARGDAVLLGGAPRLVAPTIKAGRDRVPVIRMGGTKRLPPTTHHRTRKGSRQTVGDLIFGAEFGGGKRPTTQQFRPHRGKRGYFMWPAVRAHSDRTQRMYSEALNNALRRIP